MPWNERESYIYLQYRALALNPLAFRYVYDTAFRETAQKTPAKGRNGKIRCTSPRKSRFYMEDWQESKSLSFAGTNKKGPASGLRLTITMTLVPWLIKLPLLAW